MQHRMLQEAKKAMVPWMNGQPIYAPISSNASSQGVPILYSGESHSKNRAHAPSLPAGGSSLHFMFVVLGSYLDHPVKQSLVMPPLQLSPIPLQQPPPPPPPHVFSGARGSVKANDHMLDYLENQIRGLDVGVPHMAPHVVQNMLPLHPYPQAVPVSAPPAVPHTPGPPSMLSALDEMGVKGTERRVITLPPIIQRVPSFSSRRGPGGGDGRAGTRMSSQSSGSTNRSGGGFLRDSRGDRARDVSPPRRGILRDDLDWEDRQGRAPPRGKERGSLFGRRGDGSMRIREDLVEKLHSRAPRTERSYSPPPRGRESWRCDDENGGRRKGGKWRDESEKPPSYSSIEIQPKNSYGRRNYTCISVSSTHEHWSALTCLVLFLSREICQQLFSRFTHCTNVHPSDCGDPLTSSGGSAGLKLILFKTWNNLVSIQWWAVTWGIPYHELLPSLTSGFSLSCCTCLRLENLFTTTQLLPCSRMDVRRSAGCGEHVVSAASEVVGLAVVLVAFSWLFSISTNN